MIIIARRYIFTAAVGAKAPARLFFTPKGGETIAKLTEKQKRFCEEYLVDLNATQAAVRAGYSEKYANRQAHKLVDNSRLAEYISKLREKQSRRTEITADKVLEELSAIAFSDRTEIAKINSRGFVELTPTDKLSPETKKVIASIKEGKFGTEVSSYDKVRALELIGKHLGMFSDKDSNAPSEPVRIVDDI